MLYPPYNDGEITQYVKNAQSMYMYIFEKSCISDIFDIPAGQSIFLALKKDVSHTRNMYFPSSEVLLDRYQWFMYIYF